MSAAQRCGACPRERLPCRPPGRLRAGAPLQPASWPHRLSSLLSKLFPFIRAAAVGRSRPAESSTSLFDRLGVTSSTGTSQVSSAPRIPRRAAALLEKIAAFGPAAFLSVRSFLLPRRRRASTGLRRRWSVMEPAALLVLVCCQSQPPASTVFLWFNVPCHAPAPGKGVQGTRGVHWAAPRGGVQVGGVHAPAPRILYAPPLRYRTPYRQL